jgi:kumamolisin
MDGHEPFDLRALPDSERAPAPGVKKAGSPLPGDAPVEATLILRRRADLNDATLGAILSRGELAAAHGADPADVDLVVGTLTVLGVEVLSIDAASRRVRVAGPVALLSAVFGTSLEAVTSKDAAGDEVPPSPHRGPERPG